MASLGAPVNTIFIWVLRSTPLHVVLLLSLLGTASLAQAQNFARLSGNRGCASVVTESLRRQCSNLHDVQVRECNASTRCELDDYKELLEEYEELEERIEDGDFAASDLDRMKDKLEDMERKIRSLRDQAEENVEQANRCIDAREEMQRFFMGVAVPATKRALDEAKDQREELLEALEEAEEANKEAREARDEAQDELDDDRGNRTLQDALKRAKDEYEDAHKAFNEAQKALAAFNEAHGKDIERHADRMLDHYEDENKSHQRPIDERRRGRDNCRQLRGTSLPF